MVKFITLTGELTGSARLDMKYNRCELYLRLRTRRNGRLRAFATDGSRVREVPLSGNSGTFENMMVRGLILTDEDGYVLATGNGDMCAKELESFKIGIRMLINAHTSKPASYAAQHSQPNRLPNTGSDKILKQNAETSSQARSGTNATTPSQEVRQPSQDTAAQSTVKSGTNAATASQEVRQSRQKNSRQTASEKVQRQAQDTYGNNNHNVSNMVSVEGQPSPAVLGKPKSPATAEILNKAGYLFRGESVNEHESVSGHGRDANVKTNTSDPAFPSNKAKASKCNGYKTEAMPPMREAVENPFPNFFDNSYWWRNEGDTKRIYGTANVRGIKYNVTAVRSNAKYPPNGIGRSVRRMYSTDGKRFWVGLTRI